MLHSNEKFSGVDAKVLLKKTHERKTVIIAEIKASNPYVQVLLTSDLEQSFEIKLLSSQESSLTLRP